MTDKTKKFLQKLKDSGNWNNDYDYSKVEYVNAITKVKIICKIHGKFEQTPDSHKRGSGCPKCSGNVILTTEEIINQFKEVHGDRYDYSLANYINSNTKVKIICYIHGEFKQVPSSHKSGKGCPKCGTENMKKLQGYSTEETIKQFKEVHGDRYEYSLVDCKNTKTPVKIICKKHGTFEQIPSSHKSGNNCPRCVGGVSISQEKVIEQFKEVHGNKYDYSKVDYKSTHVKIKIICPEHGEFEQTPSSHKSGNGCSRCAGRPRNLTTKETIKRFKEVHGDSYDYSMVNYINTNTKVKIICYIHGEFEQTPTHHKIGNGCPICNHGFTKQYKLNIINQFENSDLLTMDPYEIYKIIAQGKLPLDFKSIYHTDANSEERIITLKELKKHYGLEEDDNGENNQEEEQYQNNINEEFEELNQIDDVDNEITDNIQQNKKEPLLPTLNVMPDLHSLDNNLYAGMDQEVIDSLINYKIIKLWNDILNKNKTLDKIKKENGGKYFTIIKDLFLEEYNEVDNYKPKEGYSFKKEGKICEPLLMQKLTVVRLLKNKYYGNWSGTGAGKTLSFIMSSRELDSKLTLVIAVNSTIKQTCNAIKETYSDSEVFIKYKIGHVFDRTKNNYLILNYEKFQQGYSEGLFQDLTNNNKIDFVVIDEVHNMKQRQEQIESIRREVLNRLLGRIRENNPDLYTLGMSATPVINDLYESKSLLTLLSGLEYDDLFTRRTIPNALNIHEQLLLNGLRFIPDYPINIEEYTGQNKPDLNIDGEHLLNDILELSSENHIGVEKLLLEDKLKNIQQFIKKGTIIYSYYTTGFINKIKKHIEKLGFKVGTYTGEESTELREENLNKFISGNIDILIGSKPIGTGVDGLQDVCNKMIIITLPYTDSEYSQLKGRIYRQGSKFKDVEIVIPQIKIDLGNGEFWSWDVQRLNLIRNKKTLADCAVDGKIPSKVLPKPETMFKRAQESLQNWKDRINEGNIIDFDREKLKLPLYPELVEKLKRKLGDFSEMNRVWSVSNSKTTKERLDKEPEEWYQYHTLYSEQRKTWLEIPYIEISKKIKHRPDWVIGDFGCGENLLSKEIPDNKVYSFDYIAIDENVIKCDMSKVPLKDNILDVAVFSLSLMGTNYKDYLKEAYRTLKYNGHIFICEPSSKWKGREYELKQILKEIGFKCFDTIKNTDKFIYLDGVKY